MGSYCGKTCDECTHKEALNCRECKSLYGSCTSECEIADCCRRKFHETCETCISKDVCSKLSNRFGVPDTIKTKRARAATDNEKQLEIAKVMAKWTWLMFLLIIPSIVISILELDFMSTGVKTAGEVLSAIVSILYGVFLLKLTPVADEYKKASVFTIITAILTCIEAVLSLYSDIGGISLLFTIPASVTALISGYYEYNTHSDVLYKTNHELSEKWKKVWKLTVISIAITLAGAVLSVFGLLGLLIVFAGVILAIVVSIQQLICLYNTAKFYRAYR